MRRIAIAVAAVALAYGGVAAEDGCPCGRHQPLALHSTPLTESDARSQMTTVSRLRSRLDRNPHDDPAREQLLIEARVQDALPKDSGPYRAVREILPPRFSEFESRRFIVLSDASPQWTRAQAERLERAHHQFMRFSARLGLAPLPLEHKLVCVLFERREDYRRFAREHDDVRDEWIAGYYSPRHDRIVFYNVESDPQVENARSTLERMQREMAELADRAERARSSREARRALQTLGRYEQHVNQEKRRVDEFARQVSTATTIHEAIHQLAFHTRVQSPHVQNPLWLSEGLATAFETDSPNGAFGPDHEFEPRRRAFVEALAEDELIPLREFVALTSLAGFEERRVRAFYQQSYAMVTWMSRFRRAELRELLELLRREMPGPISRERQVELFTRAFGDLDRLERAWLRHELAALDGPDSEQMAVRTRELLEGFDDEEETVAEANTAPRRGVLGWLDQSAPALSSASSSD